MEHHPDKTNPSPECRSQTQHRQVLSLLPKHQCQAPNTSCRTRTRHERCPNYTEHPSSWGHPGEPGHHTSAHTSSTFQPGAAKSPPNPFLGSTGTDNKPKTRPSTAANVTHGKAGQTSERTGAPLLPGMIETVSFSQDTTLTYSCTEEGMRHLNTATFPRIDLWSSTRTVYGSLKTVEESRWLVA